MKNILKKIHFKKYGFEIFQYALAIGLSCYGFYLLKHTYEANYSSVSETLSDGFIVNPRNDVRFKTPQDLDWNLAEDKTGIHYGDSIFTGEDSKVNIELKSLLFNLEANTLIIINQLEKSFFLNLAKGSLQMTFAKGQSPFFIQVGKEKLQVLNKAKSAASFIISNQTNNNEKNKIGLSIEQGSLQFKTEKGDIIDAELGQNILFNVLNGQAQNINKFSFKLITPVENKLVMQNENIPVTFAWTGVPNTKFSVRVSTESDMRNSEMQEINELKETQEIPTNPGSQEKTQELKNKIFKFNQKAFSAAGKYFLQLQALTDTGLQFKTSVLPLNIVELRPPIIFDSTIKYLDPIRSIANLQLERIPFLDHFEIQFSHDQQFNNIFNFQKSNQSNPQYVMNEAGQIFMRARYQLKGVQTFSPWSEVVPMNIPLPIPSPQVRIIDIDLKNKLAKIEWPREPEIQSYEVIWLGKNPEARSPNKSLTETSLSIPLKTRIPQILTVTAFAGSKRKSLPSSPTILPGLLPEPHWVSSERIAPPLGRVESNPKSQLVLRWALENSSQTSVLEVSNDRYFKNKKIHILSAPELSFSSDPHDTIYARVKEQVSSDEYVAEYSSVAILPPKSAILISAPAQTLPKYDETILFPKNFAASLDLNWTPCAGAFGYDIEISSSSATNKSSPQVFTVTKSKYNLVKPQPGLYQWRVRCFDRYSQSNWSPFGQFKILYGM